MKSKVYFSKVTDGASSEEQVIAISNLFKASGFQGVLKKLDMVAIKLHVGEKHNVTHIKPELVETVVKILKTSKTQPFMTDTSTLYIGERENGIKHTLHAHRHGFSIEKTGAPFIPVDGISGNDEVEITVNGEMHETVKVAGQILLADAMVVISHATGHLGSGMGAAIKNVGMGLSSRAGKMRQHSSISPEVIKKKCEACGKCRKWCPANAIIEKDNVSYIMKELCIGCGECIAVCRYGAIMFNYAIESSIMQKSMAEHAAGIVRHFGKKAIYLNVLIDITRDCDCINSRQKKEVPDVGILCSYDMVAVDQATLDITDRAHGKNIGKFFYPSLNPSIQIEHAEKIGLGTRRYTLEVL